MVKLSVFDDFNMDWFYFCKGVVVYDCSKFANIFFFSEFVWCFVGMGVMLNVVYFGLVVIFIVRGSFIVWIGNVLLMLFLCMFVQGVVIMLYVVLFDVV